MGACNQRPPDFNSTSSTINCTSSTISCAIFCKVFIILGSGGSLKLWRGLVEEIILQTGGKHGVFCTTPSHDHPHQESTYEIEVANISQSGPLINTTDISTHNHDCRDSCVLGSGRPCRRCTPWSEDVLTSAMTERPLSS